MTGNETPVEYYARQTRNATVFIAFIVGVVMMLSIIGGIVVIHDLSTIVSPPSGDTISSSVCQADPSLAGC
jgi:hypothetical protein